MWCTLATLNLTVTMGGRQVSPVILMGHMPRRIQSFENPQKSN
jgi:hypothetical protein